jgi:bifunctional non-homologous end joining protein LigD
LQLLRVGLVSLGHVHPLVFSTLLASAHLRHLPQPKTKAAFIEPMLLLRANALPDGPNWLYELKLDGYRALGIKSGSKAALRSRKDNDFTGRYPGISKALAALPDETVVDGEVVALDETGPPLLQHPPKLRIGRRAAVLLRLRCAHTGRPGCGGGTAR